MDHLALCTLLETIFHQLDTNQLRIPNNLATKEPNSELTNTNQLRIPKNLATKERNSELTERYNACRLIPLDKNSGVRPTGIGEVMRCIKEQTVRKCLKLNLWC